MKHLLIQTEKHIRTLCGVLIWGAVSYLLQDLGAHLLSELSYLQLFWLITGITAVLIRSFFSLHSYKTELKTLKSKNTELLADIHHLNPNYEEEKEYGEAFDEAVNNQN